MNGFNSSFILQIIQSLYQVLGNVPSAPTTIGITVTFMFSNFFSSLARSRDLSCSSYPSLSLEIIIIITIIMIITNKWYVHNTESVLENETPKILKDFEIQTDHLISARQPDLVIVNKKKENLLNCGLCCSGWPQGKTERKRKER